MVLQQNTYSILITDNDRNTRESLDSIFQKQGYETHLAESGEEALEIVQDGPIHLALVNMHMPKLTGLDTIQMIRQFKAKLLCILVTDDANEGIIKLAFRVRAYSVVPKPVRANVVLHTALRALIRVYGNPVQNKPDESHPNSHNSDTTNP